MARPVIVPEYDEVGLDWVDGQGIIRTFAGGPLIGPVGDGLPATQATVQSRQDVALDPSGTVYIAQAARIRAVGTDGIITTAAGNGGFGYTGDGGPAVEAKIGTPRGVAGGPDGSIYFAVATSDVVRRVGPDGIITTVAGTAEAGYTGDGGPAVEAQLNDPLRVALPTLPVAPSTSA